MFPCHLLGAIQNLEYKTYSDLGKSILSTDQSQRELYLSTHYWLGTQSKRSKQIDVSYFEHAETPFFII